MKRPLRFLPEAAEEISETRFWYEHRQSGLGDDFLEHLDRALAQIHDRPLSFPLVNRTVRRALLHRFPYCIYFVLTGHELVILAVLYGGRKPSEWRRRSAQ